MNVLIDFINLRDEKEKKQKRLNEDYRFALLNKLNNACIELLIPYLNEHNFERIKLPQIILQIDSHWIKWFELCKKHCFNSFLLDASLHFIEFIQSFYGIFNNDNGKKVKMNSQMIA